MNTLSSEDGDASERELLVDDIQRIREVLHISAGRSNKLSSDEEEGEDSGDEDEEDDEPREDEERSLIGVLCMVLKAYFQFGNETNSCTCDSCGYELDMTT